MTVFRHLYGRRAVSALVLGLACALGGQAALASLHPHADILERAVEAATAAARAAGYTEARAEARAIDNRVRLSRCSEPLVTYRSAQAQVLGQVSIGVRCTAPKAWNLFVRVEVITEMDIPVLRQAMPRGAIINTSDLHMQRQRLSARPALYVLDMAQLVGQQLTRDSPAGLPLTFAQLRAQHVVERGQVVTLVASGGGVKVSMQGRALANAAAGERVQVINLSSGRRVEGVADADGTVRLQ